MFRFGVVALVCFAAGEAVAAISLVRQYRLGEADAGALVGLPGNPTTTDSAGGVPAVKVGNTTYDVGLFSPGSGSTLSMQFENVDSRYEAPAALLGVSDNFGIEAYIMPDPFTAFVDGRPFYNGGDGIPTNAPSDGYGLLISRGTYQGLLGGVALLPTGVAAQPGVAVDMALVRDSGVTTVYINHVAVANSLAAPSPTIGGDKLAIGNFLDSGALPPFAGVVDEARVFVFLPGQFDPGDLSPIPEPSTLVLGALGIVAVVACAGRRSPRT
ncbi:MAG: PEP-CTERM sorting domain-containing protein [Planctomycetia bacterium]|nr:PEP-CTERM sorting domain-containing protein [Planctomycetia bacterium]